MSNTICIKHGTDAPDDGKLNPYELGYSDNGILYIGVPSDNNSITKKICDSAIFDFFSINDGYPQISSDKFTLNPMHTTGGTLNTTDRIAILRQNGGGFQFRTIALADFPGALNLLTTSGGTVSGTLTVNGALVTTSYGNEDPNTAGTNGAALSGTKGQLYFVVAG